MTVIMERFSAGYVEVQRDGIFGLFAGQGAMFLAASSTITMGTQLEEFVAPKFKKDASVDWDLKIGIGIDRGTLLVRQLGLKGIEQNGVWAGMPVNAAAKLSSFGGPNEVVVSDRAFSGYERSAKVRQRALIWSCGCRRGSRGPGLTAGVSQTPKVWTKHAAPKNLGMDFASAYRRDTDWCEFHGAEFCEALITGKGPAG